MEKYKTQIFLEKKYKINCWLKVIRKNRIDVSEEYLMDINSFKIPKIKEDEHILFNLDALLKEQPEVERIGFVFFMGIGDYFYATNFIEMLKKKYASIKFDAYVSKNVDLNNNPLVGKCLEQNPNFEKIYYYKGCRDQKCWKNYDYSECHKIKSSNTFLLPMIYEHNENVLSRTDTLCETFYLEKEIIRHVPVLYDCEQTSRIKNIFCSYHEKMKRVVFYQGSSRSTNFHAEQSDDIIKGLLERGYFVISVEETNLINDNLLKIDIKKISINETIQLIKMISKEADIYVLAVASCFMSISAALKIPALIMHQVFDMCIKSVYYSNLYIITHRLYDSIPRDRQFLSPKSAYCEKNNCVSYSSEFVLACFDEWMNVMNEE